MPKLKLGKKLRIFLAVFPLPYAILFSAYLFLVISNGMRPSILNMLFNFVFADLNYLGSGETHISLFCLHTTVRLQHR